ncbi:hypothetical protein BJX61DRAFT_48852 [Aspergillus egyptiacus]|nr:hypothetical protein BJX61DRAFT_48852 [Aspergillus egyptiacus]
MLKPQRPKPFSPPIVRRRWSVIVLIVLLYLVLHHLPSSSKNGRIVKGKWLPDYSVDDIPRYLHHSSYRDHPDSEYERAVSSALQKLEQEVLAHNGGRYAAENRIWQIRLGSDTESVQRGSDSLKFEEANKEWEYTLVADDQANHFITTVLATIPELKTLYNSYPYHVIRSDLLRYLLLWYYGGYYADMDVYPAKSINSCPSLKPLHNDLDTGNANISLVVGVEIDEPHASAQLMRDWHWIRTYGLIQYTIYAPQRFSPLLREVIVRVLSHTRQHNKYSLPVIGPRYKEETILEVTGPGVFTDAILDALSDALPTTHPLIGASVEADETIGDLFMPSGEVARRVTWAPFHKIREPLCIDAREAAAGKAMGGLCVLPINAWGNGQRHSGAESFRSVHACINHRFGGTWKKGWWQKHFG